MKNQEKDKKKMSVVEELEFNDPPKIGALFPGSGFDGQEEKHSIEPLSTLTQQHEEKRCTKRATKPHTRHTRKRPAFSTESDRDSDSDWSADELPRNRRRRKRQRTTWSETKGDFRARDRILQVIFVVTAGDASVASDTDKKFQCLECARSFLQKNGLTNHMRTHTGDKPFQVRVGSNAPCMIFVASREQPQCRVCDRGFSQKCNLTRHEKIHWVRVYAAHVAAQGEKPFVCSHCSEAFSRKSSLQRHQDQHAL